MGEMAVSTPPPPCCCCLAAKGAIDMGVMVATPASAVAMFEALPMVEVVKAAPGESGEVMAAVEV